MLLIAILLTILVTLPLGGLGALSLQAYANGQGRYMGLDPQSWLGRKLGVVRVQHLTDRELAQRMYQDYAVQAGGLTWDNKPMPTFDATGPKVQANWMAAARTARKLLVGRLLTGEPS